MYLTTLHIDGMMCAMCQAHICETIRKAVPSAKKVAAFRRKREASFLSEEAADPHYLKAAIDETGYTCTYVRSAPYEKRGWFARK